MKKFLKILGITLGSVLAIVLIFAAVIGFKPLPDYSEVSIKDIQVEITPERVQRGAQLAAGTCNYCHMSQNQLLEGKQIVDDTSAFGPIFSPNITQDTEAGIGNYTDGELYRLLRTGVKRNGKLALPMMLRSATIADEDLFSIIAFLKSDNGVVQPSSKVQPAFEHNFLSRFLYTVAFKPTEYPAVPVEIPDMANSVAYGKYLVNGSLICFDCHSQSFETNNWSDPHLSEGYLGGGNPVYLSEMEQPVVSSNITMDKETGIGSWTEEEFITAIKSGVKPDGQPLQYPMMPYSFLDTTEILAIYSYLKTVPSTQTPSQAKIK